jgi:hypothetical protein
LGTLNKNILYKYRNWSNQDHKRLIFQGELYIASPKDFNDPFDCRITQNFSLLDSDEKINKYIRKLVDLNRDRLYNNGENVSQYEKRVYQRLKYFSKEEQEKWNAYTFRNQDEYYGIVSLSKIWNSILMWGHYAHNHTGFCVGLYESKLIESNYFGKGGPVIYDDSFPELDPQAPMTFEDKYSATHTKAKAWEYEQEYRFFNLFRSPTQTLKERIVMLDKTCFAEIIIGVNFPKSDIKEISDLAYSLNIPIFQAKQIPFTFTLIKEKLI